MKIMEFKFERIHGFVYLGSPVSDRNEMQETITSLLLRGNKCYCWLNIHLISQLVTRKTEIRIFKILLRLILMYGEETWRWTRSNELRNWGKYYVKYTIRCNKNGACRIRYDQELCHRILLHRLVTRLWWALNLQRMGKN